MVGLKKAVTCGSIIEDIKNEGRAEGIAEGTLEILNILATDPDFNLSLDLLVKKFGLPVKKFLM